MTHPTETESRLSVAAMADFPFRRGDNRGRVASPWKAELSNFSQEYEDLPYQVCHLLSYYLLYADFYLNWLTICLINLF